MGRHYNNGGADRGRGGKIALSHKRVTREGGGRGRERHTTEGDRLAPSLRPRPRPSIRPSVSGGLSLCGLPTCVSEGDPLCLSPFAVIYDNTLYFSQNRKRTVQGQCLRARCPQQRDLEMSRGVRSFLKKSSNLSCVKLKKGPSFRRCENSERAWEGGRTS